MKEADYKAIQTDYLGNRLTVKEYISAFMKQWKHDRDKAWGKPLPEQAPRQE